MVTPQMPLDAVIGLVYRWELETPPRSPWWVAGKLFLEPSLLLPSISFSRKLESKLEFRYSDVGCEDIN